MRNDAARGSPLWHAINFVEQNPKTEHHIVPSSRDGDDIPENKILINTKAHKAWHTLFGNFTVEEVIVIIERVWTLSSGRIDPRIYLGPKKREKAWQDIFGNADSKEAVEIVRRCFTKQIK